MLFHFAWFGSLPETQEGLHRVSLIRSQEIDGFVHGLFGNEVVVDLPKRAHRALDNLSGRVGCWRACTAQRDRMLSQPFASLEPVTGAEQEERALNARGRDCLRSCSPSDNCPAAHAKADDALRTANFASRGG